MCFVLSVILSIFIQCVSVDLAEVIVRVNMDGVLADDSSSNSQVVHPLRVLLSLLVYQEVHVAQRLPVFLGDRRHHVLPLVHLCQQGQQGQQHQGYPVVRRE